VSFTRGIDGPRYTPITPDGRIAAAHHEERRALRRTEVGTGTLACARCDAPVAIGAERLVPSDALTCPFCGHRGPLRDFLSLAAPTRPARVVVRIARRN
jgi:hypothetical protein